MIIWNIGLTFTHFHIRTCNGNLLSLQSYSRNISEILIQPQGYATNKYRLCISYRTITVERWKVTRLPSTQDGDGRIAIKFSVWLFESKQTYPHVREKVCNVKQLKKSNQTLHFIDILTVAILGLR